MKLTDPSKKPPDPVAPEQAIARLRTRILSLQAKEINIAPSDEIPHVWGVMMETGYPEAVATLVSLADGTTSLYYSTGGGMFGGGDHPNVVLSAKDFIAAGEENYKKMSRTTNFPSPDAGKVRFYALTFAGVYTAEGDEEDLANWRHDLSPLYESGQDVLTQMQKIIADLGREG